MLEVSRDEEGGLELAHFLSGAQQDGSIEIGAAQDDDEAVAGEGALAEDVHVAILEIDHDGESR
ncbi:MAG: hypothetical protein WA962_10555 [Ornithinimicrobium sp.]